MDHLLLVLLLIFIFLSLYFIHSHFFFFVKCNSGFSAACMATGCAFCTWHMQKEHTIISSSGRIMIVLLSICLPLCLLTLISFYNSFYNPKHCLNQMTTTKLQWKLCDTWNIYCFCLCFFFVLCVSVQSVFFFKKTFYCCAFQPNITTWINFYFFIESSAMISFNFMRGMREMISQYLKYDYLNIDFVNFVVMKLFYFFFLSFRQSLKSKQRELPFS